MLPQRKRCHAMSIYIQGAPVKILPLSHISSLLPQDIWRIYIQTCSQLISAYICSLTFEVINNLHWANWSDFSPWLVMASVGQRLLFISPRFPLLPFQHDATWAFVGTMVPWIFEAHASVLHGAPFSLQHSSSCFVFAQFLHLNQSDEYSQL